MEISLENLYVDLVALRVKRCKLFVFSAPVQSLLFNMAVLYRMNGQLQQPGHMNMVDS